MIIYEDGIAREATDVEIAHIEKTQKEALVEAKAAEQAAAAKEAARAAALAKLGLTADEIAALFG